MLPPPGSKWLFLRFDDLLYCTQTLFTPIFSFYFYFSFSNSQFSSVMLGRGWSDRLATSSRSISFNQRGLEDPRRVYGRQMIWVQSAKSPSSDATHPPKDKITRSNSQIVSRSKDLANNDHLHCCCCSLVEIEGLLEKSVFR